MAKKTPPPANDPPPAVIAPPVLPETQAAKEDENVQHPLTNKEMETHAHHLHKAPGKGFWHYLFEFLMLFLAVTLGFFVENQRERFVERQRENEYALSLYKDLKIDTSVIQRTLNEKQWIAAKYDSALKILETNTIKENSGFIYYTGRYLSFNDAFTSQDVTYQQLRSSGNFRYIRNGDLYKRIADYYNLYSRYQMYDNYGPVKDNNWEELEARIFDLHDFHKLKITGNFTFYDLERPVGELHPVKTDKQSLELLYIKFAKARDFANGSSGLLKWLKSTATMLIKEIEEEYPECR